MIRRIDHLWAAAILFTNGWIFTLPVTAAPLPRWFRPEQVFYGVWVHEFLLILYVPLLLIVRGGRLPGLPHRARHFAMLVAALAFLGFLSGLFNARPLHELAGAGRYLLLTAYFLAAVYWCRRYGATFVLRYLLLGITGGAVVNLYYTFMLNRGVQLGGLPFLLGEQGPGGYLGMAVVLSACLMLARANRLDTAVAVVTLVIATAAVTITFSKLAMLIAGAGIVSWIAVGWRDLKTT